MSTSKSRVRLDGEEINIQETDQSDTGLTEKIILHPMNIK